MTEQAKPLITPECVFGPWPKIFETGLPDDNGKVFYEADLLFSPEAQQTAEFARMKQAAADAVKEKWKGSTPENLRSPFRVASSKKNQKTNASYFPEEDFPGYVLVHVKSKNQPGVINAAKQKITDDTEIYGGAFVRCSVNPFAYQVKGNAGVSFWLNNVQKLRDGEPIGGSRARAEDDFEPVGAAAGADVDALFSA